MTTPRSAKNLSSLALKEQALSLIEEEDYQAGETLIEAALVKAKEEEWDETALSLFMAECAHITAICQFEFGYTDSAILIFQKAAELIADLPAECRMDLTYQISRHLGLAHLKIEQYHEAAIHFESALFACDHSKLPIMKAYYGLALILGGHKAAGEKEFEEGMELAQAIPGACAQVEALKQTLKTPQTGLLTQAPIVFFKSQVHPREGDPSSKYKDPCSVSPSAQLTEIDPAGSLNWRNGS